MKKKYDDQTPKPFADNCIHQALKVATELGDFDNVLAVGATQIGKQKISLELAEIHWANFKKLCKENGNDKSVFILLDLLCDSSIDVREQKTADHKEFWGDNLQADVDHKLMVFAGMHDDICKLVKAGNEDNKSFKSVEGNHALSFNRLKSAANGQTPGDVCVHILCLYDEFHQYKGAEKAYHKLIRDCLNVRLDIGGHNSNVRSVFITATPYDTCVWLEENDFPLGAFSSVWLTPPLGYYGWKEFDKDEKLVDIKRYRRDSDKSRNDTALRILEDRLEDFQKSDKNLFVMRQFYRKRDKADELVKRVISYCEKNKLGLLQVDQEHLEDVATFKNLMEKRHDWADLLKTDPSDPAKKKYIVILKDMFSVGKRAPTENIFAWVEPQVTGMEVTLAQRAGRVCGPNKGKNGTLLITEANKIHTCLEAYGRYEVTGDLDQLARCTTSLAHVSSERVLIFENQIISKDDERFQPSIDKIVVATKGRKTKPSLIRPLNLSGRGVKLAENGKSPDELILDALKSVHKGLPGYSKGNVAFPNPYGGEKNCRYRGNLAYGILIDGPSPHCPDVVWDELKVYKGDYFISQYSSQGSVRHSPTVKDVSKIGKKASAHTRRNMLSQISV